MSDVLAFTVPAPAKYPTFNTMWAKSVRFGAKIPEYHDLFDAIVEAAKAEMRRTGWTCAEFPVWTSITLYHRTARHPDATNLGKCENDALTAAGVWIDDELGRPYAADTEYDPNGEPRVAIMLRRRYPPYIAKVSGAVAVARKRVAAAVHAPPPPVKPQKVIEINGVPVPYDEGMRQLRLDSTAKTKGRKR